jgi:hypothetical protein
MVVLSQDYQKKEAVLRQGLLHLVFLFGIHVKEQERQAFIASRDKKSPAPFPHSSIPDQA